MFRLAWVPLLSLLACRCPPRELLCKPVAYYEVLDPQRGAGAAPFSMERLGRKVEGLLRTPDVLTLKNDNRMFVGWTIGDFGAPADLIYLPAEGLARDVEAPKLVHPMKRFKDGGTEHVRFGFRSSVCLSRDKYGTYLFCPYSEDERFLVADMTCQSVLADEVLEQE